MIIVLRSRVTGPVRSMTRAVFLAEHAVAIAVMLLHHLGKRPLILLQRHLAVAIAVEHLEGAHHLEMPRLEPQGLELLQRQAAILVGVELGDPGGAVLVDLLLGDLAVLVGIVALDKAADFLAHPMPAMPKTALPIGFAGDGTAQRQGDAGQSGKPGCESGD